MLVGDTFAGALLHCKGTFYGRLRHRHRWKTMASVYTRTHRNFLHSQKKCSSLYEMYYETNRRFVDSKAIFDNIITVIFDQVVQPTESLTRFSQKWTV